MSELSDLGIKPEHAERASQLLTRSWDVSKVNIFSFHCSSNISCSSSSLGPVVCIPTPTTGWLWALNSTEQGQQQWWTHWRISSSTSVAHVLLSLIFLLSPTVMSLDRLGGSGRLISSCNHIAADDEIVPRSTVISLLSGTRLCQ